MNSASKLPELLRQQAQILAALADALERPVSGDASDKLVPIADCGLERRAADRAVCEGKLPATRQGRCLYVRISDVLRLVETDPAKPRSRSTEKSAHEDDFEKVVRLETRRARAK
jgi:hypothetical protein